MGHEQFSVSALGLVVGVDPNGVVVAHPWDELFVLDADDTCELSDVANKRCGVSDELERIAHIRA